MSDADEIQAFEQLCQEAWGKSVRGSKEIFNGKVLRIKDLVHLQFGELSANIKLHIADKLIRESTPQVGGISDSGDVAWFLRNAAYEFMGTSQHFTDRRVIPIKTALLLSSSVRPPILFTQTDDREIILTGGPSLAALYLLSQLEYVFRVKSRYLDEEGVVTKQIPLQLKRKLKNQNAKKGARINQIDNAFLIYIYRTRSNVGKRLAGLERDLHISNRLGKIRRDAMHGTWGDIRAEAPFYALLVSLLYYGEKSSKSV